MIPEGKKQEALQQALAQIEKQYGKGTIMKLGAKTKIEQHCISTGSISLDIALGGKGIPRGRVTEIYGLEASGKTSLCLHIAANVQKEGGVAAFIDAEHALDPTFAKRIGVDLDNLFISQPDYGEQALEIAETLVRSNSVDLIVIDSVAALVPKAELEGEMGDTIIGLQARLMSSALRKLVGSISKSNTAVIFTNQIRQRIGIMFGNPETTSGGIALKFYASVRIELRRITTLKEGEEPIGTRIKSTVTKNKIAPPYMKTEFDILYSSGISREGDMLDLAEEKNIIEKSGSWYVYKQAKLGQGRERAREFLIANKNISKQIETDILKSFDLLPQEPQQVEKKEVKEEKLKTK